MLSPENWPTFIRRKEDVTLVSLFRNYNVTLTSQSHHTKAPTESSHTDQQLDNQLSLRRYSSDLPGLPSHSAFLCLLAFFSTSSAFRRGTDSRPVSMSSYFLGDPPPEPCFLASLGALSLVELDHYSVLEIWTRSKRPATMSSLGIPVTARRVKRENGGLGDYPPGSTMTYNVRAFEGWLRSVSKSSYILGDPPPDPRFLASLGALSLREILTDWTGPNDLVLCHPLVHQRKRAERSEKTGVWGRIPQEVR
jgi:hypothetical protein